MDIEQEKKDNQILLSLCMIVRDEASTIGACLSSIHDAVDEIVVVDTGSVDATVSIAREYGAIVVESTWKDDFSYSRNISLCHANGVWILWLDADDFVPVESISLLKTLKKETPDKVLGMVVCNQKPDGTGSEFLQARMFPNHQGIFFERPIHEQIMPKALELGFNLVPTKVVIEHRGYATADEMRRKAKRNVAILLSEENARYLDPTTMVEIGDSFTILEQWSDAQRWYERLLAFPDIQRQFPALVSQACMGLGNIANNNAAYHDAIEFLTTAHSLCPLRPDVLYCLAVSYEMAGDPEKAAETLTSIFPMEPVYLVVAVDFRQTQLKAALRYGRLLAELNRWDALERHVEWAIGKYPSRPEITNMAAIASYQMNKLLDSLHWFEKSIALVRDGNIDAFVGLCMIYRYAGRKAVLESTINSLYAKFKSHPRYWALCGVVSFFPLGQTLQASGMIPEQIEKERVFIEKTFRIMRI